MKFTITSIPKTFRAADSHDRKTGNAFKKALKEAAKIILDTAEPLVPVDTGALKASSVWFVEGSGWSSVAWVGYGGPVDAVYYDDYGRLKIPEEYAVYVHEPPMAYFFLEHAVYSTEQLVHNAIAQEVEVV